MNKGTILGVICVVGVGAIVGVCLMMKREPVTVPSPAQPGKSEPVPASVANLPESTKPVPVIPPEAAPTPPPVRPEIRMKLTDLVLSPGVKTLVGLDKEHSAYKDRRAALLKLTRRIPVEDAMGLRLFLDVKPGSQSDMDSMTLNGLKNDVLDVLLRQDKVPTAIGSDLAGMFRDKEHDDVWRDYCVQYIAPYYERRWPAGAGTEDGPDRTNVLAAYSEALTMKDKTFAGTALLGVERLSRTRPEINRSNITDTAVALATDETCIEANRITAFRVAALMHKEEVLPSARITAQTGSTGPLRMAAIATIGDLGDATDRELLKSFSASPEKRIQVIAEAALKKLDARQATVASKP